jgi:hypothetical protein
MYTSLNSNLLDLSARVLQYMTNQRQQPSHHLLEVHEQQIPKAHFMHADAFLTQKWSISSVYFFSFPSDILIIRVK